MLQDEDFLPIITCLCLPINQLEEEAMLPQRTHNWWESIETDQLVLEQIRGKRSMLFTIWRQIYQILYLYMHANAICLMPK